MGNFQSRTVRQSFIKGDLRPEPERDVVAFPEPPARRTFQNGRRLQRLEAPAGLSRAVAGRVGAK
jgi:hypothetical protein